MNQTYPKRLINFLSISILCLGLLAISQQIGFLRSNFENLTSIDKQSSIIAIFFVSLVIVSCIMQFKNKSPLSWIGITTYLLYSLGGFLYDSYNFGFGDNPLFLIIPFVIIVSLTIIFLFFDLVLKYFSIKRIHKVIAILLPVLVYSIIARNPITDTNLVNTIYLEYTEDQIYLNGIPFTGTKFTNHSNGTVEYRGDVLHGYEVNQWEYFYENGKIEKTINFRNGIPDGKMLSYFRTGELKEESNFKNGELNGEYKLWYAPDDLEISGTFTNGEKTGNWREHKQETKTKEDTILQLNTIQIKMIE